MRFASRSAFIRRPAVGLAAVAALALLAPAAPRADDAGVPSARQLQSANGEQIYTHICQACHMPNGQGAVGAGFYPKLAGDPALVSWEYAAVTVLNGKHGMPAFGTKPGGPFGFFTVRLSDDQIAAVVNYVRSSFGNHYPAQATAAKVAALPHPGKVSDE